MRLENVTRYACYYGPARLSALSAFDMVILQPGHYQVAETKMLLSEDTLPVAYVSIGEEEACAMPSVWALLNPNTGQVVVNPTWKTTLIDCRSPAWHIHLLYHYIPQIIADGFVGVFLDTVDIQEAYPATRSGVVELIRQIHAVYPDLLLVVNRGFSILGEIADCLDAILFEAFTTHYAAGKYDVWNEENLNWTAIQANYARSLCGKKPVLALDYAASGDVALRKIAEQRALDYGFLPYSTTWQVDWLPRD